MSNDNINHPKHYTNTPLVLKSLISPSTTISVLAMPSSTSCGRIEVRKRHDAEEKMMDDLGKAVWYLNREIQKQKKLSDKHAKELAKRRKRDRERRKAKQQAQIKPKPERHHDHH